MAFLRAAARLVAVPESVQIYDPVPHVITRRAGFERAQLLAAVALAPGAAGIPAPMVGRAARARTSSGVRWHLDVDPIEFD